MYKRQDNNDYWRLRASTNNDFYLQNYSSGSWENTIVATGDAEVSLYHNHAVKLATTTSGIELAGVENAGSQLKIGASGDFTIEHDGSNTYIKNTTGNTVIQNDANVTINASSGGSLNGFSKTPPSIALPHKF